MALARGETGASYAHAGSYADLMHRLAEGWRIDSPVYVMNDPLQRGRLVFRTVLWRDGRPQVATVPDGPEIRQFIAERALAQQRL